MQLHAADAGLRLTRTTRDVHMILHIDSGAATFAGVQQDLERLGYVLREPIGNGGEGGASPSYTVTGVNRAAPETGVRRLVEKSVVVKSTPYGTGSPIRLELLGDNARRDVEAVDLVQVCRFGRRGIGGLVDEQHQRGRTVHRLAQR